MITKLLDLEREIILRIQEAETDNNIYLDFFTKEGLKTIKMKKESFKQILKLNERVGFN